MRRLLSSRRAPAKHRGATLIELSLALAISSVLLLGMSSALVVALRSVPDPASTAATDRAAERALASLRGEIEAAIALPERTATALTLLLADRDGDGRPEVVRWWWDPAGGGLFRSQNRQPAETVVGGVADFAIEYELQTSVLTHAGKPVRGAEEMLASVVGGPPAGDAVAGSDNRVALPFSPELPDDAVAWEATGLEFRVEGLGANLLASLSPWGGNRPGAAPLWSRTVQADELPANTNWFALAFDPGQGSLRVSAGETLALVLSGEAGGADAARVPLQRDSPSLADGPFGFDPAASVWSRLGDGVATHDLFGRVWSAGPSWTSSAASVSSLRASLRAGGSRVARVIARPGGGGLPAGPGLRADFGADPATLDLTGDGVADFFADLPAGAVSGGVLSVGGAAGLGVAGSGAGLAGVSRVGLRLRVAGDTFSSGPGPGPGDAGGWVDLRFGRQGGLASHVRIALSRGAGGQRLVFETPDRAAASGPWLLARADAEAWVEVVLWLDADGERTAVWVNAAPVGTLPSPAGADDSSALDLEFRGQQNGIEIDELEILPGVGS